MAARQSDFDINYVFARNIQRFLDEKQKTRRQICNETGIKYTTLCDWINGRTIPKNDQLQKLSDYFGITPGELFMEIEMVQNKSKSQMQRLAAYQGKIRELRMSAIAEMSDEQIRELLRTGFTFQHKPLEEYIAESGGELRLQEGIDWGENYGDEIW